MKTQIVEKKKYQKLLLNSCLIVFAVLLWWTYLNGGDNRNAYITLIVMLFAVFMYITEMVSIVITSMAIPIILVLTGVISGSEAFLGFADNNVILFCSMFIIGGAMFETGVAEKLGNFVVDLTKGKERKLLVGIWLLVTVTSAFLSNTGTVAVLLPVCLSIADSAGWNRKNILMMLAITASTGGMITLVGTPPNITVNAILGQHGLDVFGFFEFAWIGIPLSLLCGIWILLTVKIENESVNINVNEKTKTHLSFQGKEIVSIVVMVAVVFTMASEIFPLHVVAAAGALICVCLKLLTEKQAIDAIDWTTIFLFAGTLVLANALDTTGAGKMIANTVIEIVGNSASEFMLLTVVFGVTVVLTQIMSNTAICALMAPIGIQIAEGLNTNPRSVLMIIAIAASSAFATPMATPPNTLVMGPGNFEMKDFLKTGIPLIIISYLISILIVPRIWPLY